MLTTSHRDVDKSLPRPSISSRGQTFKLPDPGARPVSRKTTQLPEPQEYPYKKQL